MSMDYPFYEELCRLKHPGRYWWRIGDCLYYLGMLPAITGLLFLPFTVLPALWSGDWTNAVTNVLVVFTFLVVWCIGGAMKLRSYRLAERDGIWSVEVDKQGSVRRPSEGGRTNGP